jgi:amino acid adenylation domain-containing protein
MKTIANLVHNAPKTWNDRVLYAARDGRATYGQTRQGMLQIAAWLIQKHGVMPEQRIALCLPSGILGALLTLGIVAAGGAYLPMQINSPPERLADLLKNAEPHLLITTNAMAKKLQKAASGKPSVPIISIDPDFGGFLEMLAGIQQLEKPVTVNPESLAAIFFTSGSTGEPKGVMMSHASLVITASLLTENVPLQATDRIIMLAPPHYASALGLFFPLPVGCSTFIVTEEEAMFPEIVAGILEAEKITIWDGAVTRLRHLVEAGKLEKRNLASMRYVEFFGEPMPIEVLKAALGFFPNARFQNTYGSSEAFWMTSFDIPRDVSSDLKALPIGKPLPFYDLKLCEDDGTPAAAGEAGEICVVGPVALMGYWKRPDLTAAVRLNGIPNSYRTGDLARLGDDGNYHFAGRRDHQVKIRGHRFELGEIETTIKSHPLVRDAAAFLVGQEIRACVLASQGEGLVQAINALCASRLPVFARPNQLRIMPEFPQLASGKLDRMALAKIWAA